MNKFGAAALMSTVATASRATVGTNIGGWMVLEPWITPSLFYRFLGKTHTEGVGMDQYTFCEALGPEEGNRVLRDHWDYWITEEVLQDVADREVTLLRLPIGDWTLKPYGPYVGCTDGAADKITWLLDKAHELGMGVLLDVHAVKGSQNGFDNSGIANRTEWSDETHFEHWSHALGEWMGEWDNDTGSYVSINYDNIDWAKDTMQGLLDKWGSHPGVVAMQPVNEPWWSSDLDVLKDFYRDVRTMMKEQQPHLKFVFHDSFHWDANLWNDLFEDDDWENVVIDSHHYLAWYGAQDDIGKYCDSYGGDLANAQNFKAEVWIGEWSLATDVCALWLGGFNDNNTPYAYECDWVDCPYTYMPEATGTDFDRTAEILGPFGSNTLSNIQNGKCPKDSLWYSEDDVMTLGQCMMYILNANVDAHFLWTARNELEEKWNYVQAYDKGWVKNNDVTEGKPFWQVTQ
jgi:glucan 1,3-beta-glucosidase